jgi:hypothetical protein
MKMEPGLRREAHEAPYKRVRSRIGRKLRLAALTVRRSSLALRSGETRDGGHDSLIEGGAADAV